MNVASNNKTHGHARGEGEKERPTLHMSAPCHKPQAPQPGGLEWEHVLCGNGKMPQIIWGRGRSQ